MPRLRDISATIHTPFALEGLPETPTIIASPRRSSVIAADHRCTSVFVPGQPHSLFWLSYACQPRKDGAFYMMKLFVNRRHVVTWCCGEEQQWKGKVQFALNAKTDGTTSKGGSGMRKRVLQFGDISAANGEDRSIEVKVYRADVKIRVPRVLSENEPDLGDNVHLQNGGLTKRGHPRKFYDFGLVDPLDDPYLMIRFFYRTQEEITELSQRMFHEPPLKSTPASSVSPSTKRNSLSAAKSSTSTKTSRLPQAVYRNTRIKSLPTSPKSPTVKVEPRLTPPSRLPVTPKTSTSPSSSIPSSIPRSTGAYNLRRLSIPPTLTLRHAAEDKSPSRQSSRTENVEPIKAIPRTMDAQAKDSPRTGMLRSLFRGTGRECPLGSAKK